MNSTKAQIQRWYQTLWRKVTEGDGCQPFGHDVHTMKLRHPGYLPAVDRLKGMMREINL